MAVKNAWSIQVSRIPNGETLRLFAVACAETSAKAGLPGPDLQVSTSLHDMARLSLKPITNGDDSLPGQIIEIVDRLNSDLFERLERCQCAWPIQGNLKPQRTLVLEDPDGKGYSWSISYNGPPKPEGASAVLLDSIRVGFTPLKPIVERFKGLPDELRDFHESQERVFADREAALLRGSQELQTAILRAEQDAQDRVQSAREDFQNRLSEEQAKYEKSEEGLVAQKVELSKRESELDDREHTHVRREHEKTVQTILKKHSVYRPSTATQRKRVLIHVTCILVMVGACGLYFRGLSMVDISPSLNPDVVTPLSYPGLSMLITSTLLFCSTLIFYVRWQNHWARSAAQAELAGRAFEEDFSRAYWLVELLFEWQRNNADTPFPKELLNSLSHSMFTVSREASGAAPDHPFAEALASIPNLKELSLDGGFTRKSARIRLEPGDGA